MVVTAAPGPQRDALVRAWLMSFSRTSWAPSCVLLDGDGITLPETFPGLVLDPQHRADAIEAIAALLDRRSPCPGTVPVLIITSPVGWFGDGTRPEAAALAASVQALTATGRHPTIVVGGNDATGTRLMGQAPNRIYLPWSVPPESTMLWPRLRACTPLPGRGVLLGPGTADQGDPVQCLTSSSNGGSGHRPRHAPSGQRVPGWQPLPPQVTAHALAVRSLDLGTVQWRPASSCAAVLAGPGSGATTTLQALSRTLPNATLIPHDLLASRTQSPAGGPPDPHAAPQQWWLVDDLDQLDPAALNRLAERARSGGRLLVSARFAGVVPPKLSWWHQIDQRSGLLLLRPRPSDAALLGWKIADEPSAPPGRAWFFPPGANAPVRTQIALPASPPT
jgi:S-DNA-T family DNA segregation ATPase FtsK/SpoIIIE